MLGILEGEEKCSEAWKKKVFGLKRDFSEPERQREGIASSGDHVLLPGSSSVDDQEQDSCTLSPKEPGREGPREPQ